MSAYSHRGWLVYLGLAGLALGIRLMAARGAYPACGDAGHFVQHGVALAKGLSGAMSTYWSQGMIAIAAGAVKAGCDPRYALQTTTLIAGVAVVVFFAGILWSLTGSWKLAVVGGGIVAANPAMVQYSVTGYSEMPYMAFLLAGICAGLHKFRSPWVSHGLAGLMIGMGGYFKGLDAAVAAIGYGVYVMWRTHAWKRRIALEAAAAPIMAFFILLPLCTFTYMRSGSFTPGSKGGGNFLIGSDWADSKVVYAASGLRIEERDKKQVIKEMPKRILMNSHDIVRIFNNQLFTRGLRVGTIWFGLGLVLAGSVLLKRRDEESRLPVCMLAFQLGLLGLVFVHNRLLVPSLPWLVLLFLQAGRMQFKSVSGNMSRSCWSGIVLALYVVVTGVYALASFNSEFVWWRYANTKACAKALRALGGNDQDVVMHYGPHLAIEFNKSNPLKTVEVPYGTIDEVEEIANNKQVRFIVISDTFRSHWPIAQLFVDGVTAPTNWILREELVFPEDKRSEGRAHPGERCRIYERLGTSKRADGTQSISI